MRPSCGQCIKAKRHCEGYERETTFLNRTILGWQKRGARKRDAFPKPTYIESAWTEVAANQHSLQSLYDIAQSDVTFGPHTSRLVSTINPCYLIRENLLGAFMQSYLPLADRLIPVDLAASFSWLQAATCLADPGKALSNSLSALALTRIGRKSGDERLTTKGLAFHGQALRELQKALWDPELAMRDETLSAIKTLALYEVYEDTVSVQSWEAHEEGVRQICRLRGPERHENPLAWLLFEDFRYTAVRYRSTARSKAYNFIDDTRYSKPNAFISTGVGVVNHPMARPAEEPRASTLRYWLRSGDHSRKR